MSKVKLYYDFMSQPSRALWLALKLSNSPFEDCPVALRKLEQRTEEYKKINRFQKVPCIVDGDFHLAESIAILKYLADRGQISDTLFPKDLKQRARIDEFLEWQHLTVRYGCSVYFMRLWLLPMNKLAPMPSERTIGKLRNEMENNLGLVEKLWLDKSKFIVGDQMTAADLWAATEIEQIKLTKYDVTQKHAKIADWLQRVREASNPFYDEAHKFVNKKSGLVVKQ